MKQLIVKGDDYELEGDYNDTYNDPAKKIMPPSRVYDPLIAITKTETPASEDTFVFCNGKPVVLKGEVFSKLKADIYKREWPPDPPVEEGQPPSPPPQYSDEKKSTENLEISSIGSSATVFVAGVPVCYKDDGVTADEVTVTVKDGEKQEKRTPKTTGHFIKNTAKVFMKN